MSTFYVLPENVRAEKITILGGEAHHISRVLRYAVGDRLSAVDGRGMEYEVELEAVSSRRVEARILRKRKGEKDPSTKVTLAQAIPKGSKMDYLVEKATELGVDRLIPVISARSQVLPDGDSKVRRWQRIALGAMKQSGRSILPRVDGVARLAQVVESIPEQDLSLIAWEEGGRKLRDVIRRGVERVLLFVGPEGGFPHQEVKLAVEKGAEPVSLGQRILRAETAGVVLLALLLYELGDL